MRHMRAVVVVVVEPSLEVDLVVVHIERREPSARLGRSDPEHQEACPPPPLSRYRRLARSLYGGASDEAMNRFEDISGESTRILDESQRNGKNAAPPRLELGGADVLPLHRGWFPG